MARSNVKIANFALSKIGTDSTIESLTENSAEANLCNLWFDHAREQALAAFNWSFAKNREVLAAHADDPSDDWGFRYVYPATCLKARFIFNPIGKDADPIPFEIENSPTGTKSILTDQGTAILIFTKDISTPLLYTPYFIEAFATILGSHIAYPLTTKTKKAKELREEARQMMIFAPAMDAVEGQEGIPRDADSIRGRV